MVSMNTINTQNTVNTRNSKTNTPVSFKGFVKVFTQDYFMPKVATTFNMRDIASVSTFPGEEIIGGTILDIGRKYIKIIMKGVNQGYRRNATNSESFFRGIVPKGFTSNDYVDNFNRVIAKYEKSDDFIDLTTPEALTKLKNKEFDKLV